ncbi:MAG: DNRLRE domain-containing protein [Spirochaetes bacterium]|nr:DNRLRE domain-containing protein [Spirochaetota bacterium]
MKKKLSVFLIFVLSVFVLLISCSNPISDTNKVDYPKSVKSADPENYLKNSKNSIYEEISSIFSMALSNEAFRNILKNKALSGSKTFYYSEIMKDVIENNQKLSDMFNDVLSKKNNTSVTQANIEFSNLMNKIQNLLITINFPCENWDTTINIPYVSFNADLNDYNNIVFNVFKPDGSSVLTADIDSLDAPVIMLSAESNEYVKQKTASYNSCDTKSISSTPSNDEYIGTLNIADVRKIAPWKAEIDKTLTVTLRIVCYTPKRGQIADIIQDFEFENFYEEKKGIWPFRKTVRTYYDLTNKTVTMNKKICCWDLSSQGDYIYMVWSSLKPDRHLDETFKTIKTVTYTAKFGAKESIKIPIPDICEIGIEVSGEAAVTTTKTYDYTYKYLDLELGSKVVEFFNSYNTSYDVYNIVWYQTGTRNKYLCLYPSKDTYIISHTLYTNTSYWNHPNFQALTWTDSARHNGPYYVRSYMEFNFGNIPHNLNLDNAILSLYGLNHNPLTAPNDFYLERISNSWEERLTTWNNQPEVYSASTSSVYMTKILGIKLGERIINNKIALPASTYSTQDYNINLTDWVYAWLKCKNSESANYGFRMKLANERTYTSIVFGSANNSDINKRPELYLIYK